jgi:soluble lytic murein transglycosylase-like protein
LASQKYRIPAALLTAVIEVESGFNIQAVSQKGAQGLMQLMPATCTRFGVHEPFDPWENVEGGSRYLNYLLHQWSLRFPSGQRLALCLAAYHAGERKVEQYGGVPPFKETRAYVREVLRRYKSRKEI